MARPGGARNGGLESAAPLRGERDSRTRGGGNEKGPRNRVEPGASEENLGGALLSHGRLPQYPRHWGPSLPCSEWERVLPPRHGHQGKDAEDEIGPDNRAGNMAPKRSVGRKSTSLTDD